MIWQTVIVVAFIIFIAFITAIICMDDYEKNGGHLTFSSVMTILMAINILLFTLRR